MGSNSQLDDFNIHPLIINGSYSEDGDPSRPNYEFNGVGLAAIIVFYLVILLIGLWAGWKQKRELKAQGQKEDSETVLVAGRDIKLFVGIMTMGATWVGGGFINGTAEETYKNGLIHTLAPFGYSLSLFVSGIFFAKKMRESNYITMIDPFTQKYGKFGALIAFPAAASEIIWSASILGALGSTLQVILGIDVTLSIVSSAVIAVIYTLLGGLISVAYTDVFQLFFIAFGLFLALPFAIHNEATGDVMDTEKYDWIGKLKREEVPEYVDKIFTYIFGGIPWQCYYQRVLSSKTATRAQWLSFGGGAIALSMTIPSFFYGAIGTAVNWSNTTLGAPPIPENEKIILPLILQYLTPTWVAFFGLGAISAAVMSSTDSSMLSAASMITRNVYKTVIHPKVGYCSHHGAGNKSVILIPSASEKELLIVLAVCVSFNCALATILAIYYPSVYDLFSLCSDLVYVMVFPQLLLVLYLEKYVNTYGSLASFVIGLCLRLLYGIKELGMTGYLTFGTVILEDGSAKELTPYKTILMLITLSIHAIVSLATYYAFVNEVVSLEFDVLNCFRLTSEGLVEPKTSRHLKDELELNSLKTPH